MSTQVASIVVAGMKTTSTYCDHFVVECYSDSALTTRVGMATATVAWDGTYWQQKSLITFDGLVKGNTYYMRAGVVAPVSGAIAWSPTYSESACTLTPPTVTYTTVYAPIAGGIVYTVTPATSNTDIDRYEIYWNATGTAPADTQVPTDKRMGDSPTEPFAFTVHHTGTIYVWVRAVNTSQDVASWTALTDQTPGTLDSLQDGSVYQRSVTAGGVGQNSLDNADFQVNAASGSGDLVAGWQVAAAQGNIVALADTSVTPRIGSQSLELNMSGSYSLGAGQTITGLIISKKLVPVSSADQWILRAWVQESIASLPAGVTWSGYVQCRWMYSDGSSDFANSSAITLPTTDSTWEQRYVTFAAPTPSGKRLVNARIEIEISLHNTTGSAVTLNSSTMNARLSCNQIEFIRLSNLDSEVADGSLYVRPAYVDPSDHTYHVSTGFNQQGSMIPNQPIPNPSYTSTTTSVTLSLAAQSMLLSDGSSVSTVALSSKVYSGLSANTTYYFYPYVRISDMTIQFANPSLPPTSPNSTYATQANSDGCYGMAHFSVTTPASGSGSGGGGTPCPEQTEVVEVEGKGQIPVSQVKVGDSIKGYSVQQKADVFRKVLTVSISPCAAWQIVNGHKVSPCEPVWDGENWKPAFKMPGAKFDASVSVKVSLHVDSDQFDESNFYLVSGSPLLIHNFYIPPGGGGTGC